MFAAVKDTKHENKTNVNYAYNKLRRKEAKRWQNTTVKPVDDIISQWKTYEKLNQWFGDTKTGVFEVQHLGG